MDRRFEAMATAAPGSPAIIEAMSGRVVTRAELLARAEDLAAGIREGELVALQLPNSVDFVATILAVMKLRAVAVPIDRDASAAEVERILTHFGPKPNLPPEPRMIKLTAGSSGKPKGIVTT